MFHKLFFEFDSLLFSFVALKFYLTDSSKVSILEIMFSFLLHYLVGLSGPGKKMDTIVRSSSAIWNISVNLRDSQRGSHLLLLILESHYLIADSLLCFPSAP